MWVLAPLSLDICRSGELATLQIGTTVSVRGADVGFYEWRVVIYKAHKKIVRSHPFNIAGTPTSANLTACLESGFINVHATCMKLTTTIKLLAMKINAYSETTEQRTHWGQDSCCFIRFIIAL